MNGFHVIGFFGTTLLSIRGFPQIYKAYVHKNMESFSIYTLFAWFFGCFCSTIYLLYKGIHDPLIVTNFFTNTILSFLLIVAYWKYKK